MATKNYRQGDVVLLGTRLPSAAVKDEVPVRVLARGSTSSHHHEVLGACETFIYGDRRYVVLLEDGSLAVIGDGTHPRHYALRVEAGTYEVRTQRTWGSEGARQVED